MFAVLILLVLLLAATVTDIARHKIYNAMTYPGIVLGVVINTTPWGYADWRSSLLGLFSCGAIMLVCFVLFDIGGGDVKLIAMIGGFLGYEAGIEVMLWTFVLGGISGTILLIWRVGLLRMIAGTARHLWLVLRARSWLPLNEEEREPLTRWLYLAPSAFAAVCLVTAERFWGFGTLPM